MIRTRRARFTVARTEPRTPPRHPGAAVRGGATSLPNRRLRSWTSRRGGWAEWFHGPTRQELPVISLASVTSSGMTLDDLTRVLLIGSIVLLVAVAAVRLSVRSGLPSLLIYLGIGLVLGNAGARHPVRRRLDHPGAGVRRTGPHPRRGWPHDVVGQHQGLRGPGSAALDRRRRRLGRRRRGRGAHASWRSRGRSRCSSAPSSPRPMRPRSSRCCATCRCPSGCRACSRPRRASTTPRSSSSSSPSPRRACPAASRSRGGSSSSSPRSSSSAARSSASAWASSAGSCCAGWPAARRHSSRSASSRSPSSRMPWAPPSTSRASSRPTSAPSCSPTWACPTARRSRASAARWAGSPRSGSSSCSACSPTRRDLGAQLVPAIVIGLVLLLVARPLSVFASVSWFRMPWRDQAFLSWAGLRGRRARRARDRAAHGRHARTPSGSSTSSSCSSSSSRSCRRRRCRGWRGGSGLTEQVHSVDVDLESTSLLEIGADVLQVTVGDASRLHGVAVFELRLPPGPTSRSSCADGEGFVPAPHTTIRHGDRLLVVATSDVRSRTEQRIRAVSRDGRLAGWP